jgi:hypothetical protein
MKRPSPPHCHVALVNPSTMLAVANAKPTVNYSMEIGGLIGGFDFSKTK